MDFTAPVKEDTELKNSNSNHMSMDTLVKGESLIIATGMTFNVGRIWFLIGRGL